VVHSGGVALKIAANGDTLVREDLVGTFADPTLPLPDRLEYFVREWRSPFKSVEPSITEGFGPKLLEEAADILRSATSAANRRGKAQAVVQDQLHWAAREISFLREIIREKLHEDPVFFRQKPDV
jgi:hypothetical protein